jgi:hypothetical protein
VLDAIYYSLQEYTTIPNSVEQWKATERGFSEKWNFPGCFRSINGKHVVICASIFSGSEHYNYKQDFSIVLLSMVDDNYCFRYVDIGAPGRHSDGGIFNQCSLMEKFENNELNIPEDFAMIGDSGSPLKTYLMRPYPSKSAYKENQIYNYTLSQARRTVENAFGILVSRFRVFEKPICTKVDTVKNCVRTTHTIHNWLRFNSDSNYFTESLIDCENVDNCTVKPGTWRIETQHLGLWTLEPLQPQFSDKAAHTQRDH